MGDGTTKIPNTETDDDRLVRAIAGGDTRAFAEIQARYREIVLRVACRLTGGDWFVAEDIAQETFLRLWNAANRYDPRGTLRAYLLTIVCRLAADHRRRERPNTFFMEGDLPGEVSDVARSYELGLLAEAVRNAVCRLPDEQRDVFILSHYEGLKYREIADIVGCPLGTVASRKYQAVLSLRQSVAHYLTDTPEGGPN